MSSDDGSVKGAPPSSILPHATRGEEARAPTALSQRAASPSPREADGMRRGRVGVGAPFRR